MQTSEHQLAGALLLDQKVQRSSLPFLRRNIEQVLDSHEKLKRPRKAHPLSRSDWTPDAVRHFVTPEMNEKLSPKLGVSITQITTTGRPKFGSTASNEDASGVGVRKNTNIIDVRVRLNVDIFSKKKPSKVFAHAHRIVRIHGARRQDGKFRLEIALTDSEKPIQFSMGELLDIVERGSVWREAMGEEYLMTFTLEFLSQRDQKDICAALDVKTSPGRTELIAKWDGLPRCPLSDRPLSLFAGTESTRYVLQVEMSWRKESWLPTMKRARPSTPLEAINDLKRARLDDAHLPTPAETPQSSAYSDTSTSTVIYRLGKSEIEKRGLRCFLCGGREHASLPRLRLHLTKNHPNLVFSEDPERVVDDSEEVDGEINVCFLVEGLPEGSRERRQRRADEDERPDWVGPLDLAKELKKYSIPLGIQNTERQARRRVPALAPSSEPRVHDPTRIKLELPRCEKRQITVPTHIMLNGRFFSTDRTPLQAGEKIFDDEITDQHIKQARRTEIEDKQLELEPVEQQFLKDINDHIDEENPPGTIFLGDCIRRWIHKRRDWLQDERMRTYLEAFMEPAVKKGYISQAFMDFCMKAAVEAGEGDSMVNGVGNINGSTEQSEKVSQRRHGQCKCSKEVEDISTALICSNEECNFPNYHAECVDGGVDIVDMETSWKCPNCVDEKGQRARMVIWARNSPKKSGRVGTSSSPRHSGTVKGSNSAPPSHRSRTGMSRFLLV